MKGITVSVIGEKELQRKIKKLSEKVVKTILLKSAKLGAGIVRDDARRRAPRETGNLSRNINTAVAAKSIARVDIDVGPGKKAWYGIFAELGTKHLPARPYLRPAIDEKQDVVIATVKKEMRRGIIKAAKEKC